MAFLLKSGKDIVKMQAVNLTNDLKRLSISDYIELMNKKYLLFDNNDVDKASKVDAYRKYIIKLVKKHHIKHYSEGKIKYLFDWEQIQELQELTESYFLKKQNQNLSEKDRKLRNSEIAGILEREGKCNDKKERDKVIGEIKFLTSKEIMEEENKLNELVYTTIDNRPGDPVLLIKQHLKGENRFDDSFFNQLEKALSKLKEDTIFYNSTHIERLLEFNQLAYISDYLKMELYVEKYKDKYEVIRLGFSKYNIKLSDPLRYYYMQKVRMPTF